MSRPRALLRLLLVAAVAGLVAAPASHASPFAKGPEPTAAELARPSGPYGVKTINVPQSASPMFGVATIYYPSAPAGTTFGAVGVSPGFLAEQWTLQWLAKRIASQGFATIVFTPNNVTIRPPVRSTVLLAALDYLTQQSAAKAWIDPERQAVVGHSMGGGAALEAALRRPSLKAAVPIAPWSERKGYGAVGVPTLVLGFKPDWIAPIAYHAKPFYGSLGAALPKAYLELNLDHAAPSLQQITDVSRSTTSWLKRFVDDDERYTAAICPGFGGLRAPIVTGYRSSCGSGPLAEAP